MCRHLLIDKAFIYPLPKKEQNPDGCYFDKKNGYWLTEESKKTYIFDEKSNKIFG